MLKPALCAAALVVAAAVAIPAIAQQSPQADDPSANSPAPQAGPEGRGPGWRGRWSRDDEDRARAGAASKNGATAAMTTTARAAGMDRASADAKQMMERHAMMRPFGMAHFCGPDGGRMGEFMIGRVERATQPTAEQRPGFDKLKEAIGKASETMRGACTTERPVTPTGRLAAAEKRLAAMLDAVRTVRPALDAYYGSLNDEQKARLTLAQRMGRGGGMEVAAGASACIAGATGCMTTAGRAAWAARRRNGCRALREERLAQRPLGAERFLLPDGGRFAARLRRGRHLRVERKGHRASVLAIELRELVGELVADDHALLAIDPARIDFAARLHLERDRHTPDEPV